MEKHSISYSADISLIHVSPYFKAKEEFKIGEKNSNVIIIPLLATVRAK